MLPMTLNLTELLSVSDKLWVYLTAQNRFLLTATPAIDNSHRAMDSKERAFQERTSDIFC